MDAAAGVLGRRLARADDVAQADVIVVPGGAPRGRAAGAWALHGAGVAARVAVVGGARGEEAARTAEALAALGLGPPAVLVWDEPAPGTVEEAAVTAARVRAAGWRRVHVLTSAYHVARCRAVFRAAMPGMAVSVSATDAEAWSPTGWWADARQRRLVRNEVLKWVSWRSGLRALWRRVR
jgi:uncharacterized SAM-binding protein YcdF (DUF218 family)